jgi:hypothetical protein
MLTLVADELRALRSDFQEHARATGERLSAIETSLKPLLPNGRPGKIAEIEASIHKLENGKYWLMGFAAAIGGMTSAVMHWFHLLQ